MAGKTINESSFDAIVKSRLLVATATTIHRDTGKATISYDGRTFTNIPIIYNCPHENQKGVGAFKDGDQVLILYHKNSDEFVSGFAMTVVGFPDGPRKCLSYELLGPYDPEGVWKPYVMKDYYFTYEPEGEEPEPPTAEWESLSDEFRPLDITLSMSRENKRITITEMKPRFADPAVAVSLLDISFSLLSEDEKMVTRSVKNRQTTWLSTNCGYYESHPNQQVIYPHLSHQIPGIGGGTFFDEEDETRSTLSYYRDSFLIFHYEKDWLRRLFLCYYRITSSTGAKAQAEHDRIMGILMGHGAFLATPAYFKSLQDMEGTYGRDGSRGIPDLDYYLPWLENNDQFIDGQRRTYLITGLLIGVPIELESEYKAQFGV